ncbi:MAG TPA: hypothetical protein VFS20_08900 [Longimicrobium sp.]|nr:hypothetical protein [Longimicrobium sp.]
MSPATTLPPPRSPAAPVTPNHAPALDLAPPGRLRRFFPAWVRSVLWVDSAGRYDAFLSYSWKSDSQVAPLVQSVIQRFLCPWWRPRARTVFRDLSCLPAGSSLEGELFARLDQSTHLLVLACPAAAESRGMELEAAHWCSRDRSGQILIIVTDGEAATWEEIRDRMLPPTLRDSLADEPLWIPLRHRRDAILANPSSPVLRGEVTEDLKQILLRFHPGRDWGQLRGEERGQRRRAVAMLASLALLFLLLACTAAGFGWYALHQQTIAESRQYAAQAQQVADYDPAAALRWALDAGRTAHTDEAETALRRVLDGPMALAILHHRGPVTRVALSPDGSRLATASDDGTARIWDARTGALAATLDGRSGPVSTIAFSPDGLRLATATERSGARVWDLRTGRQAFALGGHEDYGPVVDVSFSPDSARVAVAFTDGAVGIWNARTGDSIATYPLCTDLEARAAFSPDGKRLVVSGGGCTAAFVLDAATGNRVHTLGRIDPAESRDPQGHGLDREMSGALFSPDGRHVLTIMWHGEMELWNARTGALLGPLAGGGGDVTHAAFSPDGTRLVTSSDHALTLWDVEDREERRRIPGHTANVLGVRFTSDGNRVVSWAADNTVRVWDTLEGTQVLSVGGGPRQSLLHDAVISNDGSRIYTARSDSTARIWDTEPSHPRATLSPGAPSLKAAAFVSGAPRIATVAGNGAVRVWDSARLRLLSAVRGDTAEVQGTFVSPDGTALVTVAADTTVRRWDLAAGGRTSTLKLPEPPREPSFSPALRRMVTVMEDRRTAVVWDLASSRRLRTLTGHADNIRSVSLSPDGEHVVTASLDGTARVWNASGAASPVTLPHASGVSDARYLADGTRILTIGGGDTARVWSAGGGTVITVLQRPVSGVAAISANGDRLLTPYDHLAKRPAELFDLRNGRHIATLEGPSRRADVESFSPDGRWVLIAGEDREARLWDASTGRLLHVLVGHAAGIGSAAFSPDGTRLATADAAGSVRVWSVESGRLLAIIRAGDRTESVAFSRDGKLILVAGPDDAAVYHGDFEALLRWGATLVPAEYGR